MSRIYQSRRVITGALIIVLTMMVGAAHAAQPIVSSAWLVERLGDPSLKILDLRNVAEYQRRHIPGAIHIRNVRAFWQVRFPKQSGALAPDKAFAARVGTLGVSNRHHVILVHSGRTSAELSEATYLYWSFKAMGHEEVSLLEGGMINYRARQTSPGDAVLPVLNVAVYQAKMREHLIARTVDVRGALSKNESLIDYRGASFFLGINKSPFVKQYGSIPGSQSLPVAWLTIDVTGKFRSASALRRAFAAAKISVDGPNIAISSNGISASLGWFVTHEILGNKKSRLYVSGISSWTELPENPLERRLNFD